MKRKGLEELSYNIQRPDRARKERRLNTKRTKYGCELCKEYVGRVRSCWEEHLEVIQKLSGSAKTNALLASLWHSAKTRE